MVPERMGLGEIEAVVGGVTAKVVDLVGAGVTETEIGAEAVEEPEGEIFQVIGGEAEEEVAVAAAGEEAAMAGEAGSEAEIKAAGEDMAGETQQEKILKSKSCSRQAETPQVSQSLIIRHVIDGLSRPCQALTSITTMIFRSR